MTVLSSLATVAFVPVQIEQRAESERTHIALKGVLDAASAPEVLSVIHSLVRQKQAIAIDLSEVTACDNFGIAALAEGYAFALNHDGSLVAYGAQGNVKQALSILPAPHIAPRFESSHRTVYETIGTHTLTAFENSTALLQLLADTAYWGIVAPFKRLFPPPGSTTTQAVRIGVDALIIVSLISFLLGMVMAFQAAYQLRQFGANIFVANIVGLAMMRELGPLMTAIIIAGRSGSAIAAELGTMVVGEEIDALRTMGIDPIRFLVVPRFYAITFTQPALTIISITVGIIGGFIIALFYLDISAVAYIKQTTSALSMNDFIVGMTKSLAFAWVIVLIGCHCGLRITGGAVGVGRATTTSVVASIFAIIIVDSIFTTITTVGG